MTFYITTPIYYVNDKPHIGHAYTTIAADVTARWQRLSGQDVYFLTGTDEHGQKVEASAAKAGIDPQTFCDTVSQTFRHLAKHINASHDDFIRTTETRHKQGAQELWKRLSASGDIYLGSYAGWYAVRDEAFYQESELINGKAPTGADVAWVEEPSWFFKLSKYTEPLLKFYADNPNFIRPESRYNEVVRFVEGGLRDLSISRTTFKWGVPVPDDEQHVMYVWLDALANYLTALGWPEDTQGLYKKYWPANIHLVGKDILRFHAVYWPAFLMSAGLWEM
jgi:methionyl-tRNA synthetase